MDAITIIWMIVFIGIVFGAFIYFANLAFKKDGAKKND